MKDSTKTKKITYYTSLIEAKLALLDLYKEGKYIRQQKNWGEKAQSMIDNWKNKIKEIEDSPTSNPGYQYLKDSKEYYKEKRALAPKYEISVKSKKCKICGIEKPASEFNRARSNKTGLTLYCKSCIKKNYGWTETKKEEHYKKYGKYSSRKEMLYAREDNKKKQKEISYKKHLEHRKSWGSGVYLVTTTGGTYIGYSKVLRARKDQHSCKKKRPDSPIAGIYKVLDFKILEITEDKSREGYWIKKFKPTINERKGGGGR